MTHAAGYTFWGDGLPRTRVPATAAEVADRLKTTGAAIVPKALAPDGLAKLEAQLKAKK